MVDAYRIGSLAKDNPADIKFLNVAISTGAHYMTYEGPTGTDYVVPASHEFIITKIFVGSAVAGTGIVFGYGDDGVASGAPAPTNFVLLTSELYMEVAKRQYEFDVHIVIPVGKYPASQAVSNQLRCNIEGYERGI